MAQCGEGRRREPARDLFRKRPAGRHLGTDRSRPGNPAGSL